jgi:hypothetical protein
MSSYIEWIRMFSQLKDPSGKDLLICPHCHKSGIDFQYVGDLKTQIGYVVIWCNMCFHGIHISRVAIPKDVMALPFGVSAQELSNRIPKITYVQ